MADETMRPDELDVQRAETDAEAIRILTVHKAKGLEAPYVFFYGGTGGAPPSSVRVMRDESARLLVVGPYEEHIKERITREAEEEDQRLAYVALTRAQIRLYLPLYPDGPTVKSTSMYYPIQRCLGPRLAKPSTLFELFDVEIGADELPPASDDALAGFAAPAPPPGAAIARLSPERAGLTTLSYTRLARDAAGAAITSAANAFEAAEERVDDARGTDVIVVGPDELPPGADSGLMLHDVLEVADLSVARTAADAAAWRSDPDVARQLAAAARARGIADRYVRHASERIHATLTEPLALIDGSELPPLVAADQLAREVEFAFPYRATSGSTGLVKGFIDAMIVYGDELWVLDYKSDALVAPGDAKARVAEHYEVQARLYALAAERMCPDKRFAGLLFAFVRYGVVVPRRVDAEKLTEWRTWLETLPTAPADPRGEVTS
jgi:exodeoxyribonuclease V beta subunit